MRALCTRTTWMKALSTVTATALALALGQGCGGDAPAPKAAVKVTTAAPPSVGERLARAPIAPPVAPPAPPVPMIEAPAAPELPPTYKARIAAAKALAKKGLHADAARMYEAALALEQHAAPMVELARLALSLGDARTARKHVDAALVLAPGSSGAWNTLGRVELMDGDRDAAVAAFSRAVDANPDNGYAWNNLGLALLQLGRDGEAVSALERATATADVQTFMWNNLGVAYEHQDQLDMARAAYAMAAKKGSPAAKHALARLDDEHLPEGMERVDDDGQ